MSLKLMTGALKVPLNTYLLPRRSFFFGISLQGHGWLAAGDSFNSSMPGNPGRSVINHANIVEEADSLWLMICVILPLFDDPLVVSNLTEDVQSHAHRINDISGLRSGTLVQGAICRTTLDLEIRKENEIALGREHCVPLPADRRAWHQSRASSRCSQYRAPPMISRTSQSPGCCSSGQRSHGCQGPAVSCHTSS